MIPTPLLALALSVGILAAVLGAVLAALFLTLLCIVLVRHPDPAARVRRWMPWIALALVPSALYVLRGMVTGDVKQVFVSDMGWKLLLANPAHGLVISLAMLLAHALCRALRQPLPDGYYWGWLGGVLGGVMLPAVIVLLIA